MTEERKDILAALAKATGEIKRISKDSRNKEQNYDFASVDDFLAMVGPIYATNGLTADIDEESVTDFERQGKYNLTSWLRVRFTITVWHSSGQSMPPRHRTVEVIRTGAQSFGSAQSYALKQFLRALHMIPTGDKDDADYGEKGEGSVVAKPTDALKLPGKIGADQFLALKARMEIAGVSDKAMQNAFGLERLEEMLIDDFTKAMKRLQITIDKTAEQKAASDTADIPY